MVPCPTDSAPETTPGEPLVSPSPLRFDPGAYRSGHRGFLLRWCHRTSFLHLPPTIARPPPSRPDNNTGEGDEQFDAGQSLSHQATKASKENSQPRRRLGLGAAQARPKAASR
jgi:hypothetical protein